MSVKCIPLIHHFYIVKFGVAGAKPNFLIFDPKHRLWVLVRAILTCIHNLCFSKNKNIKKFPVKIFIFTTKMISVIAWACLPYEN